MNKKYIVTGGQGFIGINLVDFLLKKKNYVLCIDKITKVSNSIIHKKNKKFSFKKIDLSNFLKIQQSIIKFKPDIIFHLAAETHVDNSIQNSNPFIRSNIIGTYNLIKSFKFYYENISKKVKLINVSTDEVFGSVKKGSFNESSKYNPNSPYSASKASADHLVRAWYKTYSLPMITTNCSNNFGPYQNKEKLIPKIINNLINKKKIPIYGNGKNIRDWIYVTEHVRALYKISQKGKIGETYNIGSNNKLNNIILLKKIINIHNKINKSKKTSLKESLMFVDDRKGHDYRYAINNKKIRELGINFKKKDFQKNLIKTYLWYLKKFI